jgi:DDB1- and CUL4-associated factor 13
VCARSWNWVLTSFFLLDVILHDLKAQTHLLTLRGAHKGKISGLCFAGGNGERLLSCGVDKNVKLWDVSNEAEAKPEV